MSGRLTAGIEAAEAGQKASSLSGELQQMFKDFKAKCLAEMEKGWSGLTPGALQVAQDVWDMRAQKLAGGTADLGNVLAKNVKGILEVDDIFFNKLKAYGA
jgi:uncharacterized protein YukE